MEYSASEVIRRFRCAKQIRAGHERDWQEASDLTLLRPKHFITRKTVRGKPWTYEPYDTTARISLRLWQSLFSTMLTSARQRWFHLGLAGEKATHETRQWLEWMERNLYFLFRRDNFYTMADGTYETVGLLGNACGLIDEQPVARTSQIRGFQGFRFNEVPFEQIWIVEDGSREVRHVFRSVEWTTGQIRSYFGANANLPGKVQEYESDEEKTFECVHEIIPKDEENRFSGYHSTWVMPEFQHVIQSGDTDGNPYIVTRIGLSGGETPYGQGPVLDVLPNIRALNHMGYRKAQGVDRVFAPATAYSETNRFNPDQIRPNEWFAMQDITESTGFRELGTTLNPALMEAFRSDDVAAVRAALFADQVELNMERPEYGKAGVANSISARNLMIVGPTLNWLSRTFLVPSIRRSVQVYLNASAGRIPIPNQIIRTGINVDIIGPLAQAQKAAEMEGFDNFLQRAAAIIQIKPQEADQINGERSIRYLAEESWLPTEMLNSPEEMSAIRAQQQRQAQAQAQMAALSQGAPAVLDIAKAQQIASGQE